MIRQIFYIILFFIILCSALKSNLYSTEIFHIQNTNGVRFLAGGQYYDALMGDIQKAEKDIFVFMYLMRYAEIPYHPIYKLVN